MTLYHATIADNAYGIEADGIMASGDTSAYNYNRESDARGVYGFTSIEDAKNFALDNGWFDAVVFEFVTDDGVECIADPEYDEGVAYIVVCGGNIKAQKVLDLGADEE